MFLQKRRCFVSPQQVFLGGFGAMSVQLLPHKMEVGVCETGRVCSRFYPHRFIMTQRAVSESLLFFHCYYLFDQPKTPATRRHTTYPRPHPSRPYTHTFQMELHKAREAEMVRVRCQQEIEASLNNAKLPLSLPEPELAREDAEDGLRRLLEENQRLKDKNGGLASDVSSLRAQVKELSGAAVAAPAFGGTSSKPSAAAIALVASRAPGSPADGQRPATPSPEEEISGTVVSVGVGRATGLDLDAVDVVAAATTTASSAEVGAQLREGEEEEEGGKVAAVEGPPPVGAENIEMLELALVAPSLSRTRGQRRLSSATATGRAQFWGADGAFGDESCSKSASRAEGSRGGELEKEEKGDEEETRRQEKAAIQRVIEEEAERVYLELRANPPPEIKALLAARQEMDETAAAARTTLRDLNHRRC